MTLGSVFNRGYNLKREIAAVNDDIRAIEEVREVVSTAGWKRLRELFVEKIVSYDAKIVGLSADPVKHADEIKHKHALRSVLGEILSAVDNTLNLEQEVRAKLQKMEAARRSGTQ